MRAARWLTDAGAEVLMENYNIDALLEISPLFATSAAQLATRKFNRYLNPGENVYLE